MKKGACVKAVTGDIGVTSNGGYPLDQNLYQAPKAASMIPAKTPDGVAMIAE